MKSNCDHKTHLGNGCTKSKAISESMAHVSIKINEARLVSGEVNYSIQFPPEVELHRQGWRRGVCVEALPKYMDPIEIHSSHPTKVIIV